MPKTSFSTIPNQNTNLSFDNILEFSSLKQTLIILDHELLERLIRGDGKLREASKLCKLQITFSMNLNLMIQISTTI
jgi:hypothetical protein